jgi:hypothetical protein
MSCSASNKKWRHVTNLWYYILWEMSLKCYWIDNRLDMFCILICITATPYLLASCLIWYFIICIIASPYLLALRSLLRVFYALPKVQHTCSKNAQLSSAITSFPWRRTNTRKNHGYNAVADDSCASSHLLSWNWHSLTTKKVKKAKNFGSIHTLWSLLDQGGDVCKVWFRFIHKCSKYGTNKQKHVRTRARTNTHTHTHSHKQTNREKTFSFARMHAQTHTHTHSHTQTNKQTNREKTFSFIYKIYISVP